MNNDQIERLLDTLDRLADSIEKIEDDISSISLYFWLPIYLGIFLVALVFFIYLLF